MAPADGTVSEQRSSVLGWALGASAALHGGLAAALLAGGVSMSPPASAPVAALRVALESVPAIEILRVEPMPLLALDSPSPALLSLRPAALPVLLPAAAPSATTGQENPGVRLVEGQLLADQERLGLMHDRRVSEFPIEIDVPVRIDTPIRAHFPEAALRERREGNVALWVVVDRDGKAEEVELAYGAEEFADEAIAAVKAARFAPATDHLKPIRFPIALEFRFLLDGPATGAVAAN